MFLKLAWNSGLKSRL